MGEVQCPRCKALMDQIDLHDDHRGVINAWECPDCHGMFILPARGVHGIWPDAVNVRISVDV